MSLHFVDKLCRPELFLSADRPQKKEARVLGNGTKKKIGDASSDSSFVLAQHLFAYLQQLGQLPANLHTVEDLMAQELKLFNSACFVPRSRTNDLTVFRASSSYYGRSCFDVVSFIDGTETRFGQARLIITTKVSTSGLLSLIWLEEMSLVEQNKLFELPCVQSCNKFRFVDLQLISDLFAANPNFRSYKQYFLRPPKMCSGVELTAQEEED